MSEILNGLFNILDMSANNGLASDASLSSMTSFQKLFFKQVKDKLNVDAVFFLRDEDGIAKIPLIYFSFMDTYNPEKVAELHKLAWNMGEAPLLFIVTPTDIKIYNNYETPQRKDGHLDPSAGLIDSIKVLNGLLEQKDQLKKYSRKLFECGAYWTESKERFDVNNRIDTTLMNNLRVMREMLIKKISSRNNETVSTKKIISIVHGLLSRSIFIKYLEERKDSYGKSVFPKDFYQQFSSASEKITTYADILNSKAETYQLFEVLEKKFNGDMLPLIEQEYEIVTAEDLKELQSFLIADCDLESNQLALWPLYDFNIIPIQMISNIYELFFHLTEKNDKKGTYYTPLHLVDTMLDEIYPWDGDYSPITVLDPACGSGIFLVEMYRRIVCRWIQSHPESQTSNAVLTKLLKDCIFGIDINEEAVRIASFSLSLAMCDFMDPRSIWDDLVLPKLVNDNLVISDFFDQKLTFNNEGYTFVVGNPPWESKITDMASTYLEKTNRVIGDSQIAQAFSIKCMDICKANGKICLLMPSKGFLFNRSTQSHSYREHFFKENEVYAIINFSIYRHSLFANASAPSTAVIYKPKQNNDQEYLYYCTPKPQYTVQDAKKFSIDPTDICKLPIDMLIDDRIWKIAMWGSPRDLELIDKLQRKNLALSIFLKKNGMLSAEGFIRGNRKKAKVCDTLLNLPILDVKNFAPFYIAKKSLVNNEDNLFFRSRIKNYSIYKAPHLVIRQSHKKGRFFAAVLDYDAIFCHSLLGISGDERLLKYLCLIINSNLFTYYNLLTSRTWMVERDALEAGDIRTMPIPIPTENELREAEEIYTEMVQMENESIINDFVYKTFGLKKYEVSLVEDAMNYVYDYFDKKSKSISLKMPSEEVYKKYLQTLDDILTNSLGHAFISESYLYNANSPLAVLMIRVGEDKHKEMEFIRDDSFLEELITKLDSLLIDKHDFLYIRRNVRIYGRDTIYIVKPKQEKYWNYSSACRDADEIFADISKSLYGGN